MDSWEALVPAADRTLARAESARGELVLRRRGRDGALELRVNGVFVMDSAETSSERAIARLALDRLGAAAASCSMRPDGWRVLVGGLGLGYTLAELAADPAVAHVVVAEIEPALVSWHHDGQLPASADLRDSPRVSVVEGDLRDVVAALPAGSLDAVVLDIDNGPGFLVYDDNAAVYAAEGLRACRRALADNGVLVVWSADESPELQRALAEVFGVADEVPLPVELGRITGYRAYVATRVGWRHPSSRRTLA